MKNFVFNVLILGLLCFGEGTEERRNLKCKNPTGKLWSSILNRNCGQSVCKRKGSKAVWEECPKAATETNVEEINKLQSEFMQKLIEIQMKKMEEKIESQTKQIEEKIEQTCDCESGEIPVKMTTETLVPGIVAKGHDVYCNLCLDEEDSNHVRSVVNKFMAKFNETTGASFALVKDGRIAFAEGFGIMDKDTKEPVQASSLFRIASLSKPVTAATLMMILENQPDLLKATIFGEDGLLGTKYGTKPYSSYEKEITVQHLLEHTAGGSAWSNAGGNDPMFNEEHNWDDFTELIGWVLDSRDPEVEPGTKYAYSNFGYCVLGRVIEELSGQKYDSYVKDTFLKRIGIHNMKIARNKKSEKYENEVTYYADYDPYSINAERMDAHGGWVASVVDFANFLILFDGSKPDLISRGTYDTMVTPSSVYDYYAKGWKVNPRHSNIWHTGSLPGTGAFAMNAANGISAVFLMNYRWQNEIDPMIWEAITGIKKWY